MKLRNSFILFVVLMAFGACAPSYVPNPKAIEAQWAKTRGVQVGEQAFLIQKSNSRRVNRIAEKLARVAGVRGLKVSVADNSAWNATMQSFTKELIVYRGLLEQTPSDDELAAVISHEIGHYVFHHSMNLKQAYNSNLELVRLVQRNSSTPAKANQRAQMAVMLNEALINKPAQRNSESEADSFGIMLMQKAGYNPAAAIRVWWKKYLEGKKSGRQAGFLASHPMGDERIVNLMRTVAAFRKAR